MTESKRLAGFPRWHSGLCAAWGLWLVPALVVLSIGLLTGPPGASMALAEQPSPSPSDVPLPPPAEQPPAEEPVAEEPGPGPEAEACATCQPKSECCATCRPKLLRRLRARVQCCVSRLRCPARCCAAVPAAEQVPACAPAGCAETKKPVPVRLVSEPKQIEDRKAADAPAQTKEPKADDPHAFQPIFDGKTLKGWKAAKFGGEGEVKVADGAIHLGMGTDMTGITYEGKVPENNYELAFEAQRVKGNDFFATTTFRVGKDPLTFVVGGWGGTVVGLSNVDFYDASDNMTTKFHDFKDEKWYKVRIRVTDAKVECWIDDEKLVNQHREGHKFGIRWECELCKPLGIATWCTGSAVKNIRLRKLSPKEIEAAAKEAKQEKNEPSFG